MTPSVPGQLVQTSPDSVSLRPPPSSSALSVTESRRRIRSVAFMGLFGGGNLGNEASLLAGVELIRRRFPEAQISCICGNPAGVREKYRIQAIPFYPESRFTRLRSRRLGRILYKLFLRAPLEAAIWWTMLRSLRRFDTIIVPGTGILDDYRTAPFDVPFTLLRWCAAARLVGKRLLFVSVGAGPMVNPLSRRFLTWSARFASYVSYRDEYSRDFMTNLGLSPQRSRVFPDLVFGLSLPADVAARGIREASRRPVVGVGVMTYVGWHDAVSDQHDTYNTYLAKIASFVAWLRENDYEARLVIGEDSDLKAVQDVRALLKTKYGLEITGADGVHTIRSFRDLLAQLSDVDVVVASRYHNVIGSLMLDKPVVSVGYARKNNAVMGLMGLDAYCQDIDSFDVDRLKQQFVDLLRRRDELTRTVHERNGMCRELLEQQSRRLPF